MGWEKHWRSPESKIKGASEVNICFPAQQRQPLKEGASSSAPLMIVCLQSCSCLLQTAMLYLHFSCVGKHEQWLWDPFTNADWTSSGYPPAASAVGSACRKQQHFICWFRSCRGRDCALSHPHSPVYLYLPFVSFSEIVNRHFHPEKWLPSSLNDAMLLVISRRVFYWPWLMDTMFLMSKIHRFLHFSLHFCLSFVLFSAMWPCCSLANQRHLKSTHHTHDS